MTDTPDTTVSNEQATSRRRRRRIGASAPPRLLGLALLGSVLQGELVRRFAPGRKKGDAR